jgi:type II secretion system protein L
LIRKQCLGIHCDPHVLTAVLAERGEGSIERKQVLKITPAASSAQPADASSISALTSDLAEQLSSRREATEKAPPTVISVGGRMYQSQLHHSDFLEDRQIRQTLRFDIEEEFAVDGESLAICYQRRPGAETGADMIVHTIDRDRLESWLDRLYETGLDPLTAGPDLDSWHHYLRRQPNVSGEEVFLALAKTSDVLSMMVFRKNLPMIMGRTCLCGDLDVSEIVAGEFLRCTTLLANEYKPVKWIYHSEGFTPEQVAAITSRIGLPGQPLPDPDPAAAFAYGAAASWMDAEEQADFREDRMPPRSLTQAKHKALLSLSGAVSALLLIMVIMFKLHAWNYRAVTSQADKEIVQGWRQTHPGQKPPQAVTRITKEMRILADEMKAKNQDQTIHAAADSAAHTLLLVLKMINSMPADFDLQIDSLRVIKESANLSGSVPGMKELVALGDAINKADSPLYVDNWNFVLQASADKKGEPSGRRTFNLPLHAKESAVTSRGEAKSHDER